MRKLTIFGATAVLAVLVGTLGLLLVGAPVSATVGVNCSGLSPISSEVEDSLIVNTGTCTLNSGGEIEGNVYVNNAGFDMNGGEVDGDVNLGVSGGFGMNGGEVEDDVNVGSGDIFVMNNGTVEGGVNQSQEKDSEDGFRYLGRR